jgi:hypothetical protein
MKSIFLSKILRYAIRKHKAIMEDGIDYSAMAVQPQPEQQVQR